VAALDNRRRLQDAALDLFERCGFDEVTIDDITEAAGTSRRTYFRYFATKEDSALSDHADRVDLFGRLLQTPRSEGSTTFDHVIETARTVMSTIWVEPGFYQKRYRLIFDTPALRERMHVSDRAFVDMVTEVIRGDFRHPQAGALYARMLAAAGIELVNGVLEQWVVNPEIEADQLFALGLEALRRAATAWTDGRSGAPSVVIVARTDLSAAEIRKRLATAPYPVSE
jgi:AcrR family transcriptional regulator